MSNIDVKLYSYWGGDLHHAGFAWVEDPYNLRPERQEKIRELIINKLVGLDNPNHGPIHASPFRSSQLMFGVRTDRATHAQMLKHRVGVEINGESARYRELKEDDYIIPDDLPDGSRKFYTDYMESQLDAYHALIKELVSEGLPRSRAKEIARFLRPEGGMVSANVTMSFEAFINFQRLRNEPHAQAEIREVARKMLKLVQDTGAFDISLEVFGYGR